MSTTRSQFFGHDCRMPTIKKAISVPAVKNRKNNMVVVEVPEPKATLPKIATAPKPTAEAVIKSAPVNR